jgi:hypothetical protein
MGTKTKEKYMSSPMTNILDHIADKGPGIETGGITTPIDFNERRKDR